MTSDDDATPAPAPPPAPLPHGSTFRDGEPIELRQMGKPNPYYTVLRAGKTANVRGHLFPHDALIGRAVGCALRSPQGQTFFLVRPALARWVEAMPRFTNAIYPKDAGPLLVYADVVPGARVLEAGMGSGGLTLALLRAVGPAGQVISYDTRAESLRQGRANVEAWFGGPHPAHVVRERDIYEGIEDTHLDRVLLDLPEPWQVVPHLPGALLPGGFVASFLPSITQAHTFTNALRDGGCYPEIETFEVLHRRWLTGRRSARPDNHMVGHTGFVTVARFVLPEPVEDLG